MPAVLAWEYLSVEEITPDPNGPVLMDAGELVVVPVTTMAWTDDGEMRLFCKPYAMRRETLAVLRARIARGDRP